MSEMSAYFPEKVVAHDFYKELNFINESVLHFSDSFSKKISSFIKGKMQNIDFSLHLSPFYSPNGFGVTIDEHVFYHQNFKDTELSYEDYIFFKNLLSLETGEYAPSFSDFVDIVMGLSAQSNTFSDIVKKIKKEHEGYSFIPLNTFISCILSSHRSSKMIQSDMMLYKEQFNLSYSFLNYLQTWSSFLIHSQKYKNVLSDFHNVSQAVEKPEDTFLHILNALIFEKSLEPEEDISHFVQKVGNLGVRQTILVLLKIMCKNHVQMILRNSDFFKPEFIKEIQEIKIDFKPSIKADINYEIQIEISATNESEEYEKIITQINDWGKFKIFNKLLSLYNNLCYFKEDNPKENENKQHQLLEGLYTGIIQNIEESTLSDIEHTIKEYSNYERKMLKNACEHAKNVLNGNKKLSELNHQDIEMVMYYIGIKNFILLLNNNLEELFDGDFDVGISNILNIAKLIEIPLMYQSDMLAYCIYSLTEFQSSMNLKMESNLIFPIINSLLTLASPICNPQIMDIILQIEDIEIDSDEDDEGFKIQLQHESNVQNNKLLDTHIDLSSLDVKNMTKN